MRRLESILVKTKNFQDVCNEPEVCPFYEYCSNSLIDLFPSSYFFFVPCPPIYFSLLFLISVSSSFLRELGQYTHQAAKPRLPSTKYKMPERKAETINTTIVFSVGARRYGGKRSAPFGTVGNRSRKLWPNYFSITWNTLILLRRRMEK